VTDTFGKRSLRGLENPACKVEELDLVEQVSSIVCLLFRNLSAHYEMLKRSADRA
jgi:hypothetical protein